MYKTLLLLLYLLMIVSVNAQTATAITELETPDLDESSGLLVFDNKIITFNDSGGEPELYEVDSLTGNILRTVRISNATNVDWEDIAQDSSFIYVGDIGNNYGNREDLKIYKISKEEYNTGVDTIFSEIISFSYLDQQDFTPDLNNNNWDAESLITYQNQLLIFSKNWIDKQTNVYAIPKTVGTHDAILKSSYNVNGLITGADTSPNEDFIYLTGYGSFEAPFIYVISQIPSNTLDLFSGTVSNKITNVAPVGNQVEAIAFRRRFHNQTSLYISNEKYLFINNADTIVIPAQLWEIEIETAPLKTTKEHFRNNIKVFPNPTDNLLKFDRSADKIRVVDCFGRSLIEEENKNTLSLAELPKGTYLLYLHINGKTCIKRVVRN